ncbi:glycosyltransferase [Edwardsiella ictaluri]|uniref:glycosyltransferase n=1 Tax=Edwardsiella ictaluri TaxID=67780 RepID=UPI003783B021
MVVSSDSEGFGNVLVEALTLGTAVVSTRCPGGPAEIMMGDLARGLCHPDAASLAQALQDIYRNPPAIDDTLLQQYDVAAVCTRYRQLGKT